MPPEKNSPFVKKNVRLFEEERKKTGTDFEEKRPDILGRS